MYITLINLVGEGPCNPNPCQNGGHCEGQGSTFRCECLSGFAGDHCENSKYAILVVDIL